MKTSVKNDFQQQHLPNEKSKQEKRINQGVIANNKKKQQKGGTDS